MIIFKFILELFQSIIEVIGGIGCIIIALASFSKGEVQIKSKKQMILIICSGGILSIILNMILKVI